MDQIVFMGVMRYIAQIKFESWLFIPKFWKHHVLNHRSAENSVIIFQICFGFVWVCGSGISN